MEQAVLSSQHFVANSGAGIHSIDLQGSNDFQKAATPVSEKNWAFIDLQNLHMGIKERGWKIQWQQFRMFLKEKYSVVKAVAFLGYISKNRYLYNQLLNAGFELEFRPVKELRDGTIDGGNVDADLACYVMDNKQEYHKAIIVADDGDYFRTIVSLNRQNKLSLVISTHLIKSTSELIKRAVNRNQLLSIHGFRNQIQKIQRA